MSNICLISLEQSALEYRMLLPIKWSSTFRIYQKLKLFFTTFTKDRVHTDGIAWRR